MQTEVHDITILIKKESRTYMDHQKAKEVENLTKYIYNNYCKGNLEPWFQYLHANCVFVSPGEPMLVGSDKIKAYFRNYPGKSNVEVINETYSSIQYSKSEYTVTGNVLIGTDEYTPLAIVLMTLEYHYTGDTPQLIYQHMSYDYVSDKLAHTDFQKASASNTNLLTRLLLRQIFSIKEYIAPVCVRTGTQTYYIPPASIIYLQSNRHKTILYCVDKVLECSMPISNIIPMLPDNFCFVRRGCIVNAMYVTAIRRCEVELIFKIQIQIPVPSYTTVKENLNACIIYEK